MNALGQLRTLFVATGTKEVTRTDIAKKAYLPNKDQRDVLLIAGIMPDRDIHTFYIASTGQPILVSYYGSEREGSGRAPEYRIGRELFDHVAEGDQLLFGTDGTKVFLHRITANDRTGHLDTAQEDHLCNQINDAHIKRLAYEAKGRPAKTFRQSQVFIRNAAVREYVRRRSGQECEMPKCNYTPFQTAAGHSYIEVHHIDPLGNGGEDSVANTAAVCPECHARLHHGVDRRELANTLRSVVLRKEGLLSQAQKEGQ